MDLCTYLFFNGNCEAAFKHYEKVFGGKILMSLNYADAPAGPSPTKDTAHLIMHARLQVGSLVLMGSDAPPERYKAPQGFSAQIGVDTPEEAERIFKELSQNGQVTMPMAETFWAMRFGMLTDRFGIPWMVNCEKQQPAKPEADPNAFIISREFDAPRDIVWKAFTDPERMKQWWGPKGVRIIASTMDLRPGGTYHYGMQPPDGKEIWGKFVYREITAPEQLVFVSSFSDKKGGTTRHPMSPSWPLEMLTTFKFSEKNGHTTFAVKWAPLDPTPEERTTFDAGHASMTGGWSGTMDQLAAYLAMSKT